MTVPLILFRAYHALPPLTTKSGQPTGAIYGVVNMIRKLLKDYKPSHMVVVFDSKEKNFRHALYEPYKANRIVMPDDLQSQIAPLFDLIRALGLPLIVMPGIEADDIIGTLASRAKAQGLFTLISTGDKDFAQLVEDNIILINTMSQDVFDRDRVIEKFEVPPEQIIDYLALIGDSVDNIPGIRNVGPKTALKWLKAYGSLDDIVKNAADIPGKVGDSLREHLSELPLFRELVTINTRLPLKESMADFAVSAPDSDKLKALFTDLEFKTWLKDLTQSMPAPHASSAAADKAETGTETGAETRKEKKGETSGVQYELIVDENALERWIKKNQNSDLLALDIKTSTSQLEYMKTKIVGISFAVAENEAVYVPVAHENVAKQLELEFVLNKLRPILENDKIPKVGHNLKYAAEVLANNGVQLKGLSFDTMLESYVIDSAGTRHGIAILADQCLQYQTVPFEDIAGKGAKALSFNNIPLEKAFQFAAEEIDIVFRLHHFLRTKLEKESNLNKVFQEIEMPLVPVLVKMELGGVLVDGNALIKQSKAIEKRLQELETEAHEMAGRPFNLGSPKQLQEILFEELKLPVIEKTPTGQASTAEAVLVELAEKYPLPKIIMEHRTLSKLKSTYTDKLPEQIDPKTGRIHTCYHQAITSTGRLSSSDPNLQNIPIRNAEGRKIRKAFIASPGFKIVTADYSQIELRIMAHMSKDEALVTAFSKDDDIHRSTASGIFNVSLDNVTANQRRSAKVINFGLMYGMSAFGVSKQLGVPRAEAESYIDRYFAAFPGVKHFIAEILREAKSEGYVETLFGRRLYLPEINSSNVMRRKAAERAAVNAPMQGSNADIIKLAMIELDKVADKSNGKLRMIMQVHDELVFEVAEDSLDAICEKIKSIMEGIVKLSVELKVGIGVGDNWDEAHE